MLAWSSSQLLLSVFCCSFGFLLLRPLLPSHPEEQSESRSAAPLLQGTIPPVATATMGGRTPSSAPSTLGSQLPAMLLPVWAPLLSLELSLELQTQVHAAYEQ